MRARSIGYESTPVLLDGFTKARVVRLVEDVDNFEFSACIAKCGHDLVGEAALRLLLVAFGEGDNAVVLDDLIDKLFDGNSEVVSAFSRSKLDIASRVGG